MKKERVRTQSEITETIDQHSDRIFKVALSYTKDKATAEDILQDVLIKYMTDATEFQGEEHKKAWLIRVTINECKRFFRSVWNARKIPLEDIYTFEDAEKNDIFYAVMKLPVNYRLAIHLFYYEDMSIKEISSILKMNENTVRSTLHRGRKLLKKMLEVEYEYLRV
ncbi:MAG: polymerase subunit sigma-24 [Herbinix sp.]|jgi:RNA polymerase sigma-70 factor (ECF subfamily)|nr:polymerase subunit sigma-24 [Herbinix sp.]